MGGSSYFYGWDLPSPCNGLLTLVLVGRTGNGKSATGNSILGRKSFTSKTSSSGVTSTCELQSTVLGDGEIVNVIDTPGLFDCSFSSGFLGKEIAKCIDMAKDGIHAVLVVLSVRTRFSEEEAAAFGSLQTLFGKKINDYMIVVFTGGDHLEEEGVALDDYLGKVCPPPLEDLLTICKNRRVLFDNKTSDELKKVHQVQQLLSLVNIVVAENGGEPYSNELFVEWQEQLDSNQERLNLQEEIQRSYEEKLNRITEMVESKLAESIARLEKQLAEEQTARQKAEMVAKEAQERSKEMEKLAEDLERARHETQELRKQVEASAQNKCIIL